jgi:hypothetical protein
MDPHALNGLATRAILRGIKENLPAANSESPRAVLEFVRDAVRAATAKTIENSR